MPETNFTLFSKSVPKEIVLSILAFLTGHEAGSTANVQKSFAALKKPPVFWQQMLKNQYGIDSDADERSLEKFLVVHYYFQTSKKYQLAFPNNSFQAANLQQYLHNLFLASPKTSKDAIWSEFLLAKSYIYGVGIEKAYSGDSLADQELKEKWLEDGIKILKSSTGLEFKGNHMVSGIPKCLDAIELLGIIYSSLEDLKTAMTMLEHNNSALVHNLLKIGFKYPNSSLLSKYGFILWSTSIMLSSYLQKQAEGESNVNERFIESLNNLKELYGLRFDPADIQEFDINTFVGQKLFINKMSALGKDIVFKGFRRRELSALESIYKALMSRLGVDPAIVIAQLSPIQSERFIIIKQKLKSFRKLEDELITPEMENELEFDALLILIYELQASRSDLKAAKELVDIYANPKYIQLTKEGSICDLKLAADDEQMFKYLAICADLGDESSALCLGRLYKDPESRFYDLVKAEQAFKRGAQLGNSKSELELGYFYYAKRHSDQAFAIKAAECFAKAATNDPNLYKEISEFYATQGKLVHYFAWAIMGLAAGSSECAASLNTHLMGSAEWRIEPQTNLNSHSDESLSRALDWAVSEYCDLQEEGPELAITVAAEIKLRGLIRKNLATSMDLAVIEQRLDIMLRPGNNGTTFSLSM